MYTRRIRIVLVCLLCIVAGAGASGQQAGFELVLSSSSGIRWDISEDEPAYTQRFRGSFGGTALLGEHALLRLLAFAEYTPGDGDFLDGTYLIDLEQLFLEVQQNDVGSGRLVYRVGRISFADRTRRVVLHPADGLRLRGDFGRNAVRFDAAYTGLVLQPSSRIRLTNEDALLLAATGETVIFGPGRLLTRTGFGRRTEAGGEAGVELLTQWDLPNVMPPDTVSSDEQYHSGFLTVYFEQPVREQLVLNTSAILGVGAVFPEPSLSGIEVSLLLEALLEYYPGANNRNVLTAAFVSASSAEVGLADYRPVTAVNLGRVEPVPAAGHAQLSAAWATRPFLTGPFSGLQIVVDSRGILRLSRSQESELVHADSDAIFLGLDSGLSLRYRPVSDVALSASVFGFVPARDIAVESAVLSGSLQVTVSF